MAKITTGMEAPPHGLEAPPHPTVRDGAHSTDIRGALGTIAVHDTGPRNGWRRRLSTLLAILGPGLIVMVGDNDAGAFATYTQAGQNYGTTLLWTLTLLIPVLYVNQEMVVRLGAVARVGHARLIFERFGRFWGSFSVLDLFLVNALTLVTEFIGISLALQYLGIPRHWGVCASALLVMLAASTGDFRRFERFALGLVAGSFTLIPIFLLVHPPLGQVARNLLVPAMPTNAPLSEVMLLIIAIVGTTVAPWQLFFQQSYIIDKRITPRFIRYERTDLWLGIALVIVGAVAMIAFSAEAFHGTAEFGNYTDALGTAVGLERHAGRLTGVLFAIALMDASIIGACAVSLSTAYALGDVFAARHSLHRRPAEAKGFYTVYFGLTTLAAALVLTPGIPLGLLTSTVQALAGILLPSATVFLLLLCNDKALLGPWANGRWTNLLTGTVVAVLVMLSITLMASVLFPRMGEREILGLLLGGVTLAIAVSIVARRCERRHPPLAQGSERPVQANKETWAISSLAELPPEIDAPKSRMDDCAAGLSGCRRRPGTRTHREPGRNRPLSRPVPRTAACT